jgi:hypothetical protein
MHFEVILYFYCWYFISSWNQVGFQDQKWILLLHARLCKVVYEFPIITDIKTVPYMNYSRIHPVAARWHCDWFGTNWIGRERFNMAISYEAKWILLLHARLCKMVYQFPIITDIKTVPYMNYSRIHPVPARWHCDWFGTNWIGRERFNVAISYEAKQACSLSFFISGHCGGHSASIGSHGPSCAIGWCIGPLSFDQPLVPGHSTHCCHLSGGVLPKQWSLDSNSVRNKPKEFLLLIQLS